MLSRFIEKVHIGKDQVKIDYKVAVRTFEKNSILGSATSQLALPNKYKTLPNISYIQYSKIRKYVA
jgi:hypothetical protein